LGKNNEALTSVSKAINAIPKGRREKYYYLWKHESIVLVYLGKFDLAVRSIDMAIKLEPTDPALKTARAIFVSIFQSD
jgi:tetratricopeptide (TPR) repeat protein